MYLKSERSEHEVTVLLEDDLVTKNQYEDITTLIRSATAFPWDMLYLSFAYADRKNAVQISEELLRIPGSLTTNAYAIRESARRNILESCFPIRKALRMGKQDSRMFRRADSRIAYALVVRLPGIRSSSSEIWTAFFRSA